MNGRMNFCAGFGVRDPHGRAHLPRSFHTSVFCQSRTEAEGSKRTQERPLPNGGQAGWETRGTAGLGSLRHGAKGPHSQLNPALIRVNPTVSDLIRPNVEKICKANQSMTQPGQWLGRILAPPGPRSGEAPAEPFFFALALREKLPRGRSLVTITVRMDLQWLDGRIVQGAPVNIGFSRISCAPGAGLF
jgi:hypothetical protein